MSPFWTDRSRWARIAAVASAAWVGITWIRSMAHPYSLGNLWFTHDGFGPAGETAIIGVAVIAAVCFGVPWIVQGRKPPG